MGDALQTLERFLGKRICEIRHWLRSSSLEERHVAALIWNWDYGLRAIALDLPPSRLRRQCMVRCLVASEK